MLKGILWLKLWCLIRFQHISMCCLIFKIEQIRTMSEVTDWNKLTIPQLKEHLKKRGLDQAGKKADLISRLVASDQGTCRLLFSCISSAVVYFLKLWAKTHRRLKFQPLYVNKKSIWRWFRRECHQNMIPVNAQHLNYISESLSFQILDCFSDPLKTRDFYRTFCTACL